MLSYHIISSSPLLSRLTCNEPPPVLYELLDLRLVHPEVPHHHPSVVAEPEDHKPLLGVAWDGDGVMVRGKGWRVVKVVL
jgi:hypothetical protein